MPARRADTATEAVTAAPIAAGACQGTVRAVVSRGTGCGKRNPRCYPQPQCADGPTWGLGPPRRAGWWMPTSLYLGCSGSRSTPRRRSSRRGPAGRSSAPCSPGLSGTSPGSCGQIGLPGRLENKQCTAWCWLGVLKPPSPPQAGKEPHPKACPDEVDGPAREAGGWGCRHSFWPWCPDLGVQQGTPWAQLIPAEQRQLGALPLSQRVPVKPGGQMHSPTWSWQTPPFRQSGQSFSQDGPHFFAAHAAGRAEGLWGGTGLSGPPVPVGREGTAGCHLPSPTHLSRSACRRHSTEGCPP